MNTRQAAMSGLFYEADPRPLRHPIDTLMSAATARNLGPPRTLIVPRAGYVYSGHTAAQASCCLRDFRRQFSRVALFGPSHRICRGGMEVPRVDAFEAPLGEVKLDRAAISERAVSPDVVVTDEAHREEHSLEIQLPFSQSTLDTITPMPVGNCDRRTVARAMDAMGDDLNTLVVVSSDLSHFQRYDQANNTDQQVCDRMLAKGDSLVGEEAFGGDPERVVGYGAILLPILKVCEVSALLKAMHAEESWEAAESKATDVVIKLKTMRFSTATELIGTAIHETLTYFAYPPQHGLKLEANNPMEWLLRAARRSKKLVDACPVGRSELMLVAVWLH